MSSVIQTYELTKEFRHPLFWWVTRARALNGLTINIEPGEVYGLLGPNGSGKSTTIKLLLGMLWPTSGEVSIFGRRPSDVNVKEKIGYLPENSHLYRFLNAEETLDFYGRLFHLPRSVRKNRIDALLDLTGLSHERKRPVAEFSKGMQRRIGLAQSLINDPELIILDEPTSGMDPLGTREIKNLILQLKEKRKTVLLSSHLLADVEDVCDRVGILYGGIKRAEGTVEQLLSDDQRTQITAKISSSTIEKLKELIKEDSASEGEIEISAPMERLEKLFMRVVEDAEKEGVMTSGASASGKREVDFFSENKDGDDLLQKLSDAPAQATQPIAAQPVETKQENVIESLSTQTGADNEQAQAETPNEQHNEPDSDLLNKLSK